MGFWLVAALETRRRRGGRRWRAAAARVMGGTRGRRMGVAGGGPVEVDERLAVVHCLFEDGKLVAERPAERVGGGHAWCRRGTPER